MKLSHGEMRRISSFKKYSWPMLKNFAKELDYIYYRFDKRLAISRSAHKLAEFEQLYDEERMEELKLTKLDSLDFSGNYRFAGFVTLVPYGNEPLCLEYRNGKNTLRLSYREAKGDDHIYGFQYW